LPLLEAQFLSLEIVDKLLLLVAVLLQLVLLSHQVVDCVVLTD
jgi:hypothetical protein